MPFHHRRCHWQPVDNGWLRRVCLSLSLLSSAIDQTHSTSRWRQTDLRHYSPGIYLRAPGLLQLAALRNDWQSVPASTVGAERGSQADHPDRSAWSHHTRSKGTTPVARSTQRRHQAGHVHVQDAARPDTTVLVGRLSAHLRRESPTTVVRHVHICRATDQNSSGWQVICCCRTTDMKQSAGRSAPSWQVCSL